MDIAPGLLQKGPGRCCSLACMRAARALGLHDPPPVGRCALRRKETPPLFHLTLPCAVVHQPGQRAPAAAVQRPRVQGGRGNRAGAGHAGLTDCAVAARQHLPCADAYDATAGTHSGLRCKLEKPALHAAACLTLELALAAAAPLLPTCRGSRRSMRGRASPGRISILWTTRTAWTCESTDCSSFYWF